MGGVRIQDYPTAGYVRIDGINYDYGLFKAWAKGGLPAGAKFRIINRDNDVVTIVRLPENEPPVTPAPAIEKEIKIELPPQPEPSKELAVEVEAKLDTDEVPQVYKRNVGRPRRHKMIEEAPKAKD